MLRVVRDLLRSPIDCSQIVGVGGTIRELALSLALCVTPDSHGSRGTGYDRDDSCAHTSECESAIGARPRASRL
jgi:hypothetical protein